MAFSLQIGFKANKVKKTAKNRGVIAFLMIFLIDKIAKIRFSGLARYKQGLEPVCGIYKLVNQ